VRLRPLFVMFLLAAFACGEEVSFAPGLSRADTVAIYVAIVDQFRDQKGTDWEDADVLYVHARTVLSRAGQERSFDEWSYLSEEVRSDIRRRLQGAPTIEFVDDSRDVVEELPDGFSRVTGNSVIISLREIKRVSSDTIHVKTTDFCGSLCGGGTTFVVSGGNGQWSISGTIGPSTIS
jgi:hypothetical protein